MLLEKKKHGNNIHEFVSDKEHTFMLMSDLHWDNPKCDLELLKSHLDLAKNNNYTILINGDFFCLMQGRYDGRRIKGDVRPEHNTPAYLDAVINTAIEFFSPYAEHIGFIGYGNHETTILKHCETNVLQRFIDLLNYANKTDVQLGGYGGFCVFKLTGLGGQKTAFKLNYFHGSGGGGVVTKGVIQNNRRATFISGVDLIWQGHVHEYYHHVDIIQRLMHNPMSGYFSELVKLHHLRTPCYKEEYSDGSKGWHTMKGSPPKPLGCALLKLKIRRQRNNGKDKIYTECDIQPLLS